MTGMEMMLKQLGIDPNEIKMRVEGFANKANEILIHFDQTATIIDQRISAQAMRMTGIESDQKVLNIAFDAIGSRLAAIELSITSLAERTEVSQQVSDIDRVLVLISQSLIDLRSEVANGPGNSGRANPIGNGSGNISGDKL